MKSSSTECQAKDRSKEFDPNDLSTLSEAMEDANDDENYTEPVANSNQTRIWQEQFPDDKIIVYYFLYYYGEINDDRRAKAVEDFKTNPKMKIMLVGLRAGSEGLNLTIANRVIIVDPWWNKTAEQQAFGRVERMGQQKITHLVRILTTSDIDQRIAELRQIKPAEVDYALQDDGHTLYPSKQKSFLLAYSISFAGKASWSRQHTKCSSLS